MKMAAGETEELGASLHRSSVQHSTFVIPCDAADSLSTEVQEIMT